MRFDEIFREMREFQKKMRESFFSDSFFGEGFSESMFGDSFKEFERMEELIKSGELEGDWEMRPIEGPGVTGFVARGFFRTPRHLERPEPKPEPLPLKPLRREPREPLYDLRVGHEAVNLFVELPGVEEPDVQLNIGEGGLELNAKEFSTVIKLPEVDLDNEKMTTSLRNGVLTLTIPRRTQEKTEREE